MTTQAEYFAEHAVDGQLTPEQMVELLALPEGDTEVQDPESGKPEAAAQEETTGQEGEGAQADTTEDPENTVILARDGKHTIKYEKLVEARESASHWKQQAEAAQRQLEELQQAAAQRQEEGQAPTKVDAQVAQAAAAIEAGVDPAIFGDFSEGDLAKGIAQLVDMRVQAALALVDQKVQEKVAPLLQQQAKSAQEAHNEAILSRHPDAAAIAESQEMGNWINSKPSFMRPALEAVLKQGTAEQVVELLDTFKSETSPKPANAGAEAAAKAVAAAKQKPPMSLSELPAGGRVATDDMDAMLNMDARQQAALMLSKSPEQIHKLLDRVL